MPTTKRKCLALPLTLLLLLLSLTGYTQTYTPGSHVVVNDAVAPAQATPLDARSLFYDGTNFLYRPYNGTAEVLTYLNTTAFRTGQFIIVVDSGGSLQSNGTYIGGYNTFYMFKDSTTSGGLVKMNLFGMGAGNCSSCLQIANNLSDLGSLSQALINLGLNNVNNTSDATKNAATVTLTNHTISGAANTLTNIPNSALTNNSIGLTLNSTGTTPQVTTTPAALGASLVMTVPWGNGTDSGFTKGTDWIFFHGKLDSVHVSNDSVYNCVNGTCTLQSVISGTGGVNSVTGTNASLLFSPTTGNVLGQVNPAFSFNWSGQHTYTSFAPIFSTLTTAGGLFYGDGSGHLLQTAAGTTAQILESSGGSAPVFFTPNMATVVGWLSYTPLSGTLGSTQIYVGNSLNAATAVNMSGDATLSNTGVLTVAANAISNAKLAQMGAGTLKGNNTGSTANALDLTTAQVSAMLAVPSGLFRFSDSICNTINSVRVCVLDSAGAGGATVLTHNYPNNDSIQVNGVNAIPDNDNPYNKAGYHFNNDRNILAAIAKGLDTTAGGPIVQWSIGLLGNSFIEHINLYQQHLYNLLDSKFKSAGPGFVSTSSLHYGMTNTYSGWTINSPFTSPHGKGVDTYSAVSTAIGNTYTLAIGGGSTSYDYNQWTDMTVLYYAISGGGTFSESVDGVVRDTVNTAVGSGAMTHTINGLSLGVHTLVFKTVTEGTAHNEILGWYLWQSGTSGWVVDEFGKGSATMTSFTELDSTTFVKQLTYLAPSCIVIDNVVNDIIANEDTAVMVNKLDTILRRISSVLPRTDRVLVGPTNYGQVTWGTPTYPVSAYTNQIYRVSVDSNLIFWNPIKLYGTFANAAATLMISADSLHPTTQGSELNCSELLGMLGILSYQPPPFIPSFYTSNGSFTNVIGVARDVNGLNNELYWDSVKITRWLGGTGLPTVTLDLTNSLQSTLNSTVKWAFNQTINTTGNIASSSTSGNNILSSTLQVGSNAVSNAALSVSDNVNAYTLLGILSNSASGYSYLALQTTVGQEGYFMQMSSTANPFGDLRGPHTLNIYGNDAGAINVISTNATPQKIIFATGGGALANVKGEFARSGNWLVGLGDTTDNATAPAQVQALSAAQPQFGAYYDQTHYTTFQTSSGGILSITPTGAAVTVNGGINSSSGNGVNLQGHADLTGQTAAVATVTSYAVPGSGSFNTFRVGGYITVTAVSLDVIQLQVAWTDETSTSRTQSFFVQGATTGIGVTGANAYSPVDIRAKQGTTITVSTILTTGTGSITYDVGGNITQLY